MFLPNYLSPRRKVSGRFLCVVSEQQYGVRTLSRVLERNEVVVDHAVLDAAPLLPLPR